MVKAYRYTGTALMRPRKVQSDDSSPTRPSATLAIKFAAPVCGLMFLTALFCLWEIGQSGFVLKLLHVIAWHLPET